MARKKHPLTTTKRKKRGKKLNSVSSQAAIDSAAAVTREKNVASSSVTVKEEPTYLSLQPQTSATYIPSSFLPVYGMEIDEDNNVTETEKETLRKENISPTTNLGTASKEEDTVEEDTLTCGTYSAMSFVTPNNLNEEETSNESPSKRVIKSDKIFIQSACDIDDDCVVVETPPNPPKELIDLTVDDNSLPSPILKFIAQFIPLDVDIISTMIGRINDLISAGTTEKGTAVDEVKKEANVQNSVQQTDAKNLVSPSDDFSADVPTLRENNSREMVYNSQETLFEYIGTPTDNLVLSNCDLRTPTIPMGCLNSIQTDELKKIFSSLKNSKKRPSNSSFNEDCVNSSLESHGDSSSIEDENSSKRAKLHESIVSRDPRLNSEYWKWRSNTVCENSNIFASERAINPYSASVLFHRKENTSQTNGKISNDKRKLNINEYRERYPLDLRYKNLASNTTTPSTFSTPIVAVPLASATAPLKYFAPIPGYFSSDERPAFELNSCNMKGLQQAKSLGFVDKRNPSAFSELSLHVQNSHSPSDAVGSSNFNGAATSQFFVQSVESSIPESVRAKHS